MSDPPGNKLPKGRSGLRSVPSQAREPGWADGLRHLYNSVLHEPLPGSFDDLLKKLDEAKDDDG